MRDASLRDDCRSSVFDRSGYYGNSTLNISWQTLNLPTSRQSPATIIQTHGTVVGANFLRKTIQTYLETDDVFAQEFLQGIILLGASHSDIVLDDPLVELLREWGNKWIEVIPPSKASAFAPGPYIVDNQALFQIWKIYDDYNFAFLKATWPSMDNPR